MEANTIEQKLERIEKLLISQKTVLNFEELVEYTRLSQSYLYKLTSKGDIPFYRPNGKQLYFNKAEIKKEREAVGLSIPTDVEIEVLAQTWSEHCKHKIFSARIDYENRETGRREVVDLRLVGPCEVGDWVLDAVCRCLGELRREHRRLRLTKSGERMLAGAHKIVSLNDELWSDGRSPPRKLAITSLGS